MTHRDARETVRAHFARAAELKLQTADTCADDICRGADLIAATFKAGGKLLLCGNGGSAADCQHRAAESNESCSVRAVKADAEQGGAFPCVVEKNMKYVNSDTGVEIELTGLTEEKTKFYRQALEKFRKNVDWLVFEEFVFGPMSPLYSERKSRLEVIEDRLYLALEDMWLQSGGFWKRFVAFQWAPLQRSAARTTAGKTRAGTPRVILGFSFVTGSSTRASGLSSGR